LNSNCRSRDEIALWKEKQIQVAREEMRVKESLAKLKEEAQAQKKTPQPKTAPSSATVCKVKTTPQPKTAPSSATVIGFLSL
jgi:hypothetical protein